MFRNLLNNKITNYLIPLSIGAIAFALVLDYKILILSNVGWLNLEDPIQHYLGWEFYRADEWRNPVGLNPNFGMNISSSLVFSDSIPLFAILFKLLTNNVTGPIQYFGWWLFFCFLLQAYFSYKLISIVTKNLAVRIFFCGTMLFVPSMLARTNIHMALASHFLLVASIYLIFTKNKSHINYKWFFLLVASLGIHFYLFFMVFILYIADSLDGCRNSSPSIRGILKKFILLIIAMIALVVFAWQFGYLAINVQSTTDIGFGSYQMNLLGLINSTEWSLLQKRSYFSHPSFEGMNYLGFGIIFLLLCSIFTLRKRDVRVFVMCNAKKHLYLLISLFMFLSLSLTHIIDIGTFQFTFNISNDLIKYANIVRSSGRLFWPIFYCLTFIASLLVLKGYSFRASIFIFGITFLLQVVDTSKGWIALGDSFNKSPSSSIPTNLKNDFWQLAAKKYKKIEIFPVKNWPSFWANIADYAHQNKMQTSVVRMARVDQSKLVSAQQQLEKMLSVGDYDGETLYVFQEWKDNLLDYSVKFDSSKDLLARVDDIIVLAPNWKMCDNCTRNTNYIELQQWKPSVGIGKEISFANKNNSEFLLNGWVTGGNWGYWSIGDRSRIVIPITNEKFSTIAFNVRALVGPAHPNSIVEIYIDGNLQKQVTISRSQGNSFSVEIPKKLNNPSYFIVDFVYKNPTSPQAIGYGNGDDRKLTIGLESLILR
jgi:hypothetical protein